MRITTPVLEVLGGLQALRGRGKLGGARMLAIAATCLLALAGLLALLTTPKNSPLAVR